MSIAAEIAIGLQRRFDRQRLRTFILGSIPFIVLGALWHMNAVFRWLPEVFIPDIGSVLESIVILQEDCPSIGAARARASTHDGLPFRPEVRPGRGRHLL